MDYRKEIQKMYEQCKTPQERAEFLLALQLELAKIEPPLVIKGSVKPLSQESVCISFEDSKVEYK